MLLRSLVAQFVRQAAEQKLHEEVARQKAGTSESTYAETENSESRTPPRADVAIVFALGIESGGLVDMLSNVVTTRCQSYLEHLGRLHDRSVAIADVGIGCESAATGTRDVIALHQPQWIVSAGFASGLHPDLRRGHVLMPDHVVDAKGESLAVPLKVDPSVVQATPGLHMGQLLTVDHVISTREEKQQLAQDHNAVAYDMETHAVAKVCSERKVRFLSVRVITDGVDDPIPPDVEVWIQQKGLARKIGAAAGAFVNRPSVVKDMWKLKAAAMKASERLARFLDGVIPQLDIENRE